MRLFLARSAGLEPATFSVRSHSRSETGTDTGGQGRTKPRFYQVLALLEGQGGTGRDTRLRSHCGQNLRLSRWVLEPEVAEGYQKASSRQLGECRGNPPLVLWRRTDLASAASVAPPPNDLQELDLLVDALPIYYCHSLGVRNITRRWQR